MDNFQQFNSAQKAAWLDDLLSTFDESDLLLCSNKISEKLLTLHFYDYCLYQAPGISQLTDEKFLNQIYDRVKTINDKYGIEIQIIFISGDPPRKRCVKIILDSTNFHQEKYLYLTTNDSSFVYQSFKEKENCLAFRAIDNKSNIIKMSREIIDEFIQILGDYNPIKVDTVAQNKILTIKVDHVIKSVLYRRYI